MNTASNFDEPDHGLSIVLCVTVYVCYINALLFTQLDKKESSCWMVKGVYSTLKATYNI